MISNIVIVCPINHWEQCQFLLNSIDRHLKDFNVYLIDNTVIPSLPTYNLRNNKLTQLVWSDIVPTRKLACKKSEDGWIVQQLIKLAVHTLFENESYVCLDTKNIILSSLDEWPVDTFASIPPSHQSFSKFYNSVCTIFDFAPAVIPPQTPYELDALAVKELIEYFGGWDQFQEWFTSFHYPSEFMLYDIWCQKTGRTLPRTTGAEYKFSKLISFIRLDQFLHFFENREHRKNNTVALIFRAVWEHPDFLRYRQHRNFSVWLRNSS
jgi:hypothetical protein